MKQEITCINCPVGCRLQVEMEDGKVISVTGNTCARGVKYAQQECTDPQRMITAVVPVEGSNVPLSIKTASPVPKKLIADCMAALAQVKVTAPVKAGSVVLSDVCGTGVNVIATKNID